MAVTVRYSWDDFECAVEKLLGLIPEEATKVYGEPRGGLCLAVAISHRSPLEFTTKPDKHTWWVDDIYDTGETAKRAAQKPLAGQAFWVVKNALGKKNQPVGAVHHIGNSWVVFPWEYDVEKDIKDYYARRNADAGN